MNVHDLIGNCSRTAVVDEDGCHRDCARRREDGGWLDIEIMVVLHRQVPHPPVMRARDRAADHCRDLAVGRLEALIFR